MFFLFVLAYLTTFEWMWDRWFSEGSYYSHGILVPIISAILIWQKRDILKKIRSKPSLGGNWLFLAGIIVHILSIIFRVYFTSGFSMIMVLAGFVLAVYGRDFLKEVLFPVIFLVFMVPIPIVIIINIIKLLYIPRFSKLRGMSVVCKNI